MIGFAQWAHLGPFRLIPVFDTHFCDQWDLQWGEGADGAHVSEPHATFTCAALYLDESSGCSVALVRPRAANENLPGGLFKPLSKGHQMCELVNY